MMKPRRLLLNMKIKTHKESSGQRPCLSLCPGAANDQTKASHREWYREKQTGYACPGASLEPIQKQTAQHVQIHSLHASFSKIYYMFNL